MSPKILKKFPFFFIKVHLNENLVKKSDKKVTKSEKIRIYLRIKKKLQDVGKQREKTPKI